MNPMDCKQAQNVWSRVMAAQTAAPGLAAASGLEIAYLNGEPAG